MAVVILAIGAGTFGLLCVLGGLLALHQGERFTGYALGAFGLALAFLGASAGWEWW